jgi:hypothetical protein
LSEAIQHSERSLRRRLRRRLATAML